MTTRPAVHTIAAEGATLIAQTEGAGDPVVLVHGFADDRRSWDGIAQGLSGERLVVRYDLRGYGESIETGQVRFRHSQDLSRVLDTLRIARFDLIGLSMGGGIALNFALDFAERVRHLILISPAPVGWQWTESWRSAWMKIREVASSQGLSQARELWWSHPVFSATRDHPAAADILRRSISQYSGNHWLGDNEERAAADIGRLHALRVPTLLITGKRDVEDFRSVASLIEAAAPQVSRFDVDGAGHMPHLEYPSQVLERVRGFLSTAS